MRYVHARARVFLCVSMQQFVGLLDLNIEAAYSWLMPLTFFLSARQNNAVDVYLQYATLLSVVVLSVFRQACASACFVNYPVIYRTKEIAPLRPTALEPGSPCCIKLLVITRVPAVATFLYH